MLCGKNSFINSQFHYLFHMYLKYTHMDILQTPILYQKDGDILW